MKRRAIIIGAGPAGLTAAYELLRHTDYQPVIVEMSESVGGLAKTVLFRGNRMDIGGHRFFSKSEPIVQWWLDVLPLQYLHEDQTPPLHAARRPDAPSPDTEDRVMLMRERHSRIYFDGKYYEYPLRLSIPTLRQLGWGRIARIGATYLRRALFPIRPADTLEDFMINRFGDTLYHTFFKSYTEKVWGISCREISAEWGAQRIKDVSVSKALEHWCKKVIGVESAGSRNTPTSLVERFFYPKHGPGQLWEAVADRIVERGGEILFRRQVVDMSFSDGKITGISVMNAETGRMETYSGDLFFSSMPVQELITALGTAVPSEVREVAQNLCYRDFIAVGLLARKLQPGGGCHGEDGTLDSWLYIQDPSLRIGRLQFYNHWSPYMVENCEQAWLGLEYFCQENDDFWTKSDSQIRETAIQEIAALGIVDPREVLDAHVIRVPKAYPAYTGSYARFDRIRAFLDPIPNLFLIGRNGMHRYNNQDHSMLTAMAAVRAVIHGNSDKGPLWAVNAEDEYLEEA